MVGENHMMIFWLMIILVSKSVCLALDVGLGGLSSGLPVQNNGVLCYLHFSKTHISAV